MTKIKTMLALASLLLAVSSAQAGVKVIGEVNGLKLVRVKTMGIFCPSTTTVVLFDPAKPGTVEGVINHAGGPGVLQSVAQPASIAAGAYLLKPDSTRVTQSGGGSSSIATGGTATSTSGATAAGGNANGNTQQHVPPGHINNPSGNN
jgi:hypothetical protein